MDGSRSALNGTTSFLMRTESPLLQPRQEPSGESGNTASTAAKTSRNVSGDNQKEEERNG